MSMKRHARGMEGMLRHVDEHLRAARTNRATWAARRSFLDAGKLLRSGNRSPTLLISDAEPALQTTTRISRFANEGC